MTLTIYRTQDANRFSEAVVPRWSASGQETAGCGRQVVPVLIGSGTGTDGSRAEVVKPSAA
jgi:hypothetical protein